MTEVKKKEREESEKKRLLNRLSRIEGQIRGIKKMVEEDIYCTDILTQVTAATSALDSFSKEILGTHIKTCVVNNIKKENYEVIDELLETIQKMMK